MQKTSMSVTRALVELKRLNDRISHAINGGTYVVATVGRAANRKVAGTNENIQDAENKIKSSFDKVTSLISNREKIKSKLVLSNATTQVKILNRSMTVAEAIELKNTVQFRRDFLTAIRRQKTTSAMLVEKQNAELDTQIERLTTTMLGADKAKADSNVIETIANTQKDQKLAELFDPANTQKHIETIEKEISDLESELDFVLSESNASTVIEVELT